MHFCEVCIVEDKTEGRKEMMRIAHFDATCRLCKYADWFRIHRWTLASLLHYYCNGFGSLLTMT